MKIIKPTLHAILDYVVVVALWLSPSIFAYTPWVALFTYVLGAIHLVLTLTTDFPGGALKLIPMKIHGMIELVVAIVLFVAPWFLSNITSTDKYYYLLFAGVVFITWLFSDYTKTIPAKNT